MRTKLAVIVMAGAALCHPIFGAPIDDLFDAVRGGDAGRVKALLQSGADANARDDIGATPLLYAAALPSQDCLRVLLDGGADVNASTTNGSTALMWATADAPTVRLLLDRGAAVNAKTKDDTTALVTAARRGNAEVMKLLLARGGNLKASAKDGLELLQIAYNGQPPNGSVTQANLEIRRIVNGAGLELKSVDQLGPTGLLAGLGDPVLLRRILDLGANPNETLKAPGQVFPMVALAVFLGDVDYVRALLERGADPNNKTSRGVTLLMFAANADHPNPAMVRLLIGKGADVNARDDLGRTALDWATLQGETGMARLLRDAGAKSGAAPSSAPSAVSRPRSTRTAIEMAIARLQPIGPVFNKHTGCISCHNQSLPEFAVKVASARGVPIDAETAPHPAKVTLDLWKSQRENLMLAREAGIGGFIENVTYGLWALAEEGLPADSATDAVVSRLSAMQGADGSWPEIDIRPPLGGISPLVFTALAIRGLDVYAPPGLRDDAKKRIARGLEFLRKASPVDTQEESFKLLGFVWSGAPAAEISRQRERVQALQRADDGWGQLPTMASDSYSTGQALYALAAGGLSSQSSGYRKGVAYLLRTQLDDGTWFVRSRAFPAQAFFESGFPHGMDQFISAAATSWAAIALAGALAR
jgi:ankyrin repeat protein